MSNIRVTYSGLIAFGVAILGVVTGTLFIIMVTRKLSPEDFGLWTLIGSLVGYVTIVEPIVTYWSTRQIARGVRIGKTAISTSGVFSAGGLIAYFIIALYVSISLDADLNILLLASFLIPLTFFVNILNSISLGYKPQNASFGSLSFEITKIPLGMVFVVFLQFGIIGALVTTIIAKSAQLVILVLITKEHLSGRISLEHIKFWLKMSWLTLYQSFYGLIYKLDVLLISIFTGSLVGLAYWGAASAVSNLVSHSRNLSQGLYPKLLAVAENKIAEENLKRSMFFAIPLLGGTILFVKPIMYILNPIYVDGYFISIIIAFRSFANLLMGFFFSILESFETIDMNTNATFKKYIKSNLFLTPTFLLILSTIYVVGLAIFLILPDSKKLDEINIVTIWAYILLVITVAFMILGYVIVKKRYNFSFPIIPIGKYLLATIIASIPVYFYVESLIVYTESVYDFIPQLIFPLIMGGLIYFGISYLIDNSTRELFWSIVKEIRKK